MPVTVKGSGGGGVTLDAGAAASNTTLTLPNVNGTILQSGTAVTVAQGGTGATSLTANNVLLGNGTSAVQVVAPGASGTVLVSNGTTWTTSVVPAFSAYMVSNLTISSGVVTKISYNTKIFDTNTNYDTTLYRFTPTVAGYYFFTFSTDAGSSTSATRVLAMIYKNGSMAGASASPTTGAGVSFSSGAANAFVYMNGTTDYVEPYVFIQATTAVAAGGVAYAFGGYMARGA